MTAPSPAILRDPAAAGLVRIGPGEVEAVLAAGAAAGLCCARIELAGCRSKPEFLARVADALEFPWWFGQNWDALADCLGDLEWLPAEGYLLVLDDPADLRRAAPDDYAVAVEVFSEAARAWRERNTPCWVFISGEKEAT
ncbi:barstar family protein [Thioalkalivibrio sp. XN8]|uniref:barstar family protein n=1 Tax=Thioalkalivibrio sp. XN8 TaxID=2712863 RepID=UPI0013EC67EA|nr:barstar family protein [Thioalkalivibrio sp. XN8]NGP53290.1 barstar family protein [Thioalkalivibrio sp. XN8]